MNCLVYLSVKLIFSSRKYYSVSKYMKPETAVKLVEALETLNRNKKLLVVAAVLTVALAKFDIGILGDENPNDWSVL